MAGTAVSIHGIVGVFAQLYPTTDFAALSKLTASVALVDSSGEPLLDGGGQARSADFFSVENPLWLTEGILVHGKSGLLARMSFHTRRTMATLLRQQIGI